MRFRSFDGGEAGEHSVLGSIGVSKIFMTWGDFLNREAAYDGL